MNRKLVVLGVVCVLGCMVLVSGGCGGRGSQMSRLKNKMKDLKRNQGIDDEDSDDKDVKEKRKLSPRSSNQANEKTTSTKSDDSNSNSAASKPLRTASSKEKIERSAKSDDPGFVAFKSQLLARYAEKRKTLTRAGKLKAIGRAFGEYVRNTRSYPPRGVPTLDPNFSWRIEILKYLGYEDLYDQFDLSARYNSPLNERLMELIPPEFEFKEGSSKTTVVAPLGSHTAYWSPRNTRLTRLEDGIADTGAFLVVPESMAVEWTRPAEVEVMDYVKTLKNESDGFVVIGFGDGRVEKVNLANFKKFHRPIFSYDAGDRYPATVLSPLEDADFQTQPVVAANEDNATGKGSGGTANTGTAGQNAASQAVSPRGSAMQPRSNTGPIAKRLMTESQESLVKRRQTDAFNLRMAAMLVTDDPGALFSDFRWSKALQRPAFALRWKIGIAILDTEVNPDPVTRSVNREKTIDRPGNDILEEKTGQIGLDAAIVLRKLVNDGLMGEVVQKNIGFLETEQPNGRNVEESNLRRNRQLSPDDALFNSKKIPDLHYSGIEVTMGTSRSYHVQVAKDRTNDLLLLLDIELKRYQGDMMSITTPYVIDVQRGRELWRGMPLNNLKIRKDRTDALKEDAVFTTLKKLDDFCRSEIALTDLPRNLSRENILKRLRTLAGKSESNKLPFLVEARFYLLNNLILLDDYKTFCQKVLLDNEEGTALAVGTPAERLEAIRKFLPKNLNLVSR